MREIIEKLFIITVAIGLLYSVAMMGVASYRMGVIADELTAIASKKR